MTASLCAPTTAAAQPRMPHRDASGLGVEVGVFVPQQNGRANAPEVSGFFEHYMTARDSLRVSAGWTAPEVNGSPSHSTREVRVGGDLIHNWEGGAIHPFLGAGLGVYFLQGRAAGNDVGDSAARLGGTLLGGAELFTAKTIAVKAEARYNVVSGWNGYNPSGFALTIGLKSYF
jgi:hypothetical protein